MAHAEQNLAIFRGRLKFKSNVQKIWGVFILLSIITTVEVALGIAKPEFLTSNTLFALKYFRMKNLSEWFDFQDINFLLRKIRELK
jgi:hypothetical protein